ncbi:hypothetical protein [Agrobacterium tumefaciens]|uniref:hypothetical protein n=1 Tax=Agrobacterium tumefaciens TaxID=358 RepID=UPI000EF273E7|nr:hypothetical protein [Agrobacterium tumefaciens]AYM05664.1 hypothetical protein At1D1460_14220 [Agrobacterium tumefaciens]NSZ32490.1 hypothetical protein [Agrobacterium tumefaciens]QLG22114.1 hypothetical protein EML4_07175 [Agrobacterium tumefaciens]UXS86005.1 hypothetical protein FY144_07150 [Agrobacterium tumefaciens]
MTDFLEVKAKRTFAVGKELKTKKSDPFKVEAGEAKQLDELGLVEILGEAQAAVDDGDADEADDKPVISSARSTKKKDKPDAVNEGS